MQYDAGGRVSLDHITKICNTIYVSTGYPTRYINEDFTIVVPSGFENVREPFERYLRENIEAVARLNSYPQINPTQPGTHFMPLSDIFIHQHLHHKGTFRGMLLVGPLRLSEASNGVVSQLHEKNKGIDFLSIHNYLSSIQPVNQEQIAGLQNLLMIVAQTNVNLGGITGMYALGAEAAPVSSDRLERTVLHHAYQKEERMLSAILLSGKSLESAVTSTLGDLIAAPLAPNNLLRSEQNRFISAVAVVSRGAIRLGVNSETAFNYADYFIRRTEEVSSLEEVSGLMAQMFATYRAETVKAQQKSEYSLKIRDVIDYIDDHIEQDLDLKSVTDLCGYDYKYISRLFAKEVGMKFSAYINLKKIALARRLLADFKYKIEDVSDYLGFAHHYYFSKVFKAQVGLSPSEYRKKLI